MNVSRVMGNVADYCVKKPLNALGNNKLAKKAFDAFERGDTNVMGKIAIASILLKDGLGCYMYVNQSLNNKKIPSDKRKFVAALDLTNGGLMILTQLITYKIIEGKKFQGWLFDKLFAKNFDRPVRKGFVEAMMKTDKYKTLGRKVANETFNKYKEMARGPLKMVTSIFGAVIIGKRMIVPFIATPLADKAKVWMCRNDKPETVHKETDNTFDKTKSILKPTNFLDRFKTTA